MKRYNLILVLLLIASNALVMHDLHVTRNKLANLRGTIVNIDAVRQQYLSDAQYLFAAGCHVGIDYPAEFRKNVTGFNPNSPVMYCSEKLDSRMEYIMEQAAQIGN